MLHQNAYSLRMMCKQCTKCEQGVKTFRDYTFYELYIFSLAKQAFVFSYLLALREINCSEFHSVDSMCPVKRKTTLIYR